MKPFVAKRAAAAEASATLVISAKTAEMRRRGIDVVALSVGEPDFDTPEFIKDSAKRALDDNFTHYTPSPGIPELRSAIAELSKRDYKISCEDKNVLVTPTKHALFASGLAFVEPGDEVLIPDPSFVSYAPIVAFCGGKPVWVPLKEENGFGIKSEEVRKLLTPKTKMIWLCSPSNPTGGVDDPKEVRAIAELSEDKDFLILSDEIYAKMIYEGTHLSPGSVAFDRTITINGLSKSHAMTGWRAGWIVADAPLYEPLARIQTQSITHITSFVQKAMVDAIRGPQDSVAKMMAEFRARRDLVVREMSKIPGLHVPTPHGAFYAWPRFDVPQTSVEVAEFLLDKHHVAVVPGTGFGPSGSNRLRISFGASQKTLMEGIRRMANGFRELRAAKVATARV